MGSKVEGNKIASWWKFVLGHTGKEGNRGSRLDSNKAKRMEHWTVPQDITVPQEAQSSLATSTSLLLCHQQLSTLWVPHGFYLLPFMLASVFTAIGIFPHTATALACIIPGSPRPGTFWWFKQKTPREDYYRLFLGHMPMAEPITEVKQLGVLLQPCVMERSSPKSGDSLATWSNFSEKKSVIGRSIGLHGLSWRYFSKHR